MVKVVGGESGETMEEEEEKAVGIRGESEVERLVRGCRRESGSWF